MAAASAGKIGWSSAKNSNLVGSPPVAAVEHNCSVSGSAVGSWEDYVDFAEEEEMPLEQVQGEQRREKRKRVGSSSGRDDSLEARERTRMFVVLRFNERTQVHIKKLSPFLLTAELNSKVGDIVSAKVLSDGNLLVQCVNEEQLNKALNLKQFGKFKVEMLGKWVHRRECEN